MGHSRSLEQKVSAPIPGNYDYASALADDIFSFNRAYPRMPIAIERTVKDRLVQAEVLPISAWKSTEPPRINGASPHESGSDRLLVSSRLDLEAESERPFRPLEPQRQVPRCFVDRSLDSLVPPK
jgi:hypothetical protein